MASGAHGAADYLDSLDVSSSENESRYDEEEANEFEIDLGVQGYQFEPQRKVQNRSISESSSAPAAASRSSGDATTRVGNTNWFGPFSHFFTV